MASLDGSAAKLSWIFNEVDFGDVGTWGVHTGVRDLGDVNDLFDIMEGYWALLIGQNLLNHVALMRVVYSEWATAPFVGWHQRATKEEAIVGGSDPALPKQCQIVTTYRLSTGLEARRSRNRFYLPGVRTAIIDAAGRIDTTAQGGIGSAGVTLHTDLAGVTAADPALAGLCIASPAGNTILQADQLGVGRGIDTQRRRADKVPEDIVYASLP
jgi:hypothetical protein